MDNGRSLLSVVILLLLGEVALASGVQGHQDSRATGDPGYAIEQQRRQTQQQMQEERDAHRDRAESRERELQDNIQQRRDEMLENLDRDASTGRGE